MKEVEGKEEGIIRKESNLIDYYCTALHCTALHLCYLQTVGHFFERDYSLVVPVHGLKQRREVRTCTCVRVCKSANVC